MGNGEPNEVSAAIADMEADFAGREDLVTKLYWLGREYEEYPDKYPSARQKYEQIIGEYPDSVEASQAQLIIVEAYEKLLQWYPKCQTADYAAFRLGQMSMKAGELERAKGFYELFLEMVGPEDYRVERVEAELEKIDAML